MLLGGLVGSVLGMWICCLMFGSTFLQKHCPHAVISKMSVTGLFVELMFAHALSTCCLGFSECHVAVHVLNTHVVLNI